VSNLFDKIEKNKFYRFYFCLRKNLLLLQLNDRLPVESNIFDLSVRLSSNLIIGNLFNIAKYWHESVENRLEMKKGFHGCIQFIKINNKIVNISFPSDAIQNGVSITECPQNECNYERCNNNGRCLMTNRFNTKTPKPKCLCFNNHFGERCEFKKNSCLDSPCGPVNSSSCIPTSTGSFQCICKLPFGGRRCQQSNPFFVIQKKKKKLIIISKKESK
jgi:hypothetical protein